MIPFCKPTLGEEEEQAVLEILRSGWLAAGEKTRQFEEEFAKYVSVKYAIFTNSGTAALKMAYKYFKDQGYKSYFLLTPNTFCATYSAAEEVGLVASDKGTNESVFVVTHYGGMKYIQPPMHLEDSAHRIEKDDPLIGKIRIYSFYVTKNLTTGAGGMFVTNDKYIYQKARLWANDGIDKNAFDRQNGGWNYRVLANAGGYDGNDLAAAIGLEQLKKLPDFTAKRNAIRDRYNNAFNQDWQGNHIYPYFVKEEKDVGRLIEHLKNNDIQASYHYPGTGWLGVSLPIYPLLTLAERQKIIEAVRSFE